MTPRLARGIAAVLAVLAAASWLAGESLAASWVVRGDSMLPALRPGDRVLVDLWTYAHRPPRRGEVVLAGRPGTDAVLVKRVAATPRDRGVWLLGDNAAASDDSRAFGAVPFDRLRGRVILRYWPPSRFGAPGPATDPRR